MVNAQSRRAAALAGAVGAGLFLAGLALALGNLQSFHATAEQVAHGAGVTGGYTDTVAADGDYRVLREMVAESTTRTAGDVPGGFDYLSTPTDVVNLLPYTMPAEGGTIYRIGIYVVQTGSTQIRVALYGDTDDMPRLLLAQSAPMSATNAGWLWFDIEPQTIRGGTRYWLAYQADNDNAKLGWWLTDQQDGYRYRSWSWGDFPTLIGNTWGPINRRTCYQIAYTTTRYVLDAEYTIPVSPTMDVYTLTIRGATSREPFSVSVDGYTAGVIGYNPTIQHPFSDDIESGTGDWIAEGFTRIVTDSDHYNSPTHTWWVDDVPYGNSSSLTSPPITLPFNIENAELRFWHRMAAEFNWDGGWLEYRLRKSGEGWSDWSLLTDTMFLDGGYNSTHPLSQIPSGSHWAWTGDVSGWVRVQIPITAAGHIIQWRWRFECDVIGSEHPDNPNGWWIDDVRVVGMVSEDSDLAFTLPLFAAADREVSVRFQDTTTDSYPDLLGIDLIEIEGYAYSGPITVTLSAPDGGEVWGGTRAVEWTGLHTDGGLVTYTIYASPDGGATWTSPLYEVSYYETGAAAPHLWAGFDTTAFGDGNSYLVRIEASDGEASDRDQSTAAFTIDNTSPSVTLLTPNGGEMLRGGDPYTITWSASDAHFDPTPIALYYSTDNGISFPFTITSGTANDGSFTWILPTVDSDGVRVRAVATDQAGNSTHDDSVASFTIDSTPPNGTVTVTDGDYTRDRVVHLALGAPSDAAEMYISGDVEDAANMRQWTTYTPTAVVTLTAGEGSKAIRVRYRDGVGNESDPAEDTILYDTTPPTMTSAFPADGATVPTASPIISATLSDVTSGIDGSTFTMTVDGVLLSPSYDENSGTVSCTPGFALTNSSHEVRLSAQDRAGNAGTWTWSFSVDEPPASVVLHAHPTSIVADGVSTTTITATVRSQSGYPVADGIEVVFTTSAGSLSGGTTYTTTTQNGVATARLKSSEAAGIAIVTAQAGEVEGNLEVMFFHFEVYLPMVITGP